MPLHVEWDIKNLVLNEFVERKINEKIAKLEEHLKHFPKDACRIHIQLEHNARKPLSTAALTLNIPSHTLRSTKSAKTVVTALEASSKVLMREVEKIKSRLRDENLLRRRRIQKRMVKIPSEEEES